MINPSKIILSSEMPGMPTYPNPNLAPSDIIIDGASNYIGSWRPYNTVGMNANQFDSVSTLFDYPETIPPGAVVKVMIAIRTNGDNTPLVGNIAQMVHPLGAGGVAPFHDTIWNFYVSQQGNQIRVDATRYNNGGSGLFASGAGSPELYIFAVAYQPPF